jgi:hypothetical protein
MKIGLVPDYSMGWQGGRDFFFALADSLNRALEPEDESRILLVVRRDSRRRRIARIAKRLLFSFPPDLQSAKSELVKILDPPDMSEIISEYLGTIAEQFNVEIISEQQAGKSSCNYLPDVIGPWHGARPSGLDVPCVGHVADCQHLRLPENFSSDEIAERNARFSEMLQEMPVLVVLSESVKSDLLHYFPCAQSEIISLPFCAAATPEWLAADSTAARNKYKLPSRYFLCSNQFWHRKNHEVVFEAQALARIEGSPISIVFTGSLDDYRAPEHASSLMQRVQKLGVAEDCLFLGLIPKLDQIAIMKSAIGVIQPSLFEGSPGGGAVHDAISVGTPVIVSDIPVNREIEDYVDVFFPPRDPAALLTAIRSIENLEREKRPADVLLAEGHERRLQCGRVLRSAFVRAIDKTVRPKSIGSRQGLEFVQIKMSSPLWGAQ